MNDYNMIFVVGTGRSGTTITGTCLKSHSECDGVSFEMRLLGQSTGNNGLYILLEEIAANRTLRMKRLRQYLLARFRPDELAELNLPDENSYEALVDRLLDRVGHDGEGAGEKNIPHVREFLDSLLLPNLERSGARYIVDDTPVNGLYIPELLKLYPSAKFIHMYRDGISVANSYLQRGWKNNFTHALKKWQELFDMTCRLGRAYGGDSYMEINLNEMAVDSSIWARIQEFVGFDNIEDISGQFRPKATQTRIDKIQQRPEQLEYFQKVFPDMYERFYAGL
ncbi:sulfotransferase [Flexibacterium corallicola]|uniref:sulfotransferase n=1 Tax=Flexibacterium corallicola TaxID=3037259 RepID=UPI00286EDA84|nr:sulfotransferase [Pseudovibrio sp. M1P-2-3]